MRSALRWLFFALFSVMPFVVSASSTNEDTGVLEDSSINGTPVFQVCDLDLNISKDILKMRLLSLIKERDASTVSGSYTLSNEGFNKNITLESRGAFFGVTPSFINKRYLNNNYICAYLPKINI